MPNKTNNLRLILNLSKLSFHVKQTKFQIVTVQSILFLLRQDNWMCSIDLLDAFYHIKMDKAFRKFLHFRLGSSHYQFQAIPFRLATAPKVFMKCMEVVMPSYNSKGYESSRP